MISKLFLLIKYKNSLLKLYSENYKGMVSSDGTDIITKSDTERVAKQVKSNKCHMAKQIIGRNTAKIRSKATDYKQKQDSMWDDFGSLFYQGDASNDHK